MNQLAVAVVTDVEVSRFVVIDCPFCGERHRHYWSLYKPSAPTFVAKSHCKAKRLRGFYEVRFPAGGLRRAVPDA